MRCGAGDTVERRLEIMRDSRVGSFAVAGCVSVLLVKYYGVAIALDVRAGFKRVDYCYSQWYLGGL